MLWYCHGTSCRERERELEKDRKKKRKKEIEMEGRIYLKSFDTNKCCSSTLRLKIVDKIKNLKNTWFNFAIVLFVLGVLEWERETANEKRIEWKREKKRGRQSEKVLYTAYLCFKILLRHLMLLKHSATKNSRKIQ